MGVWMRWSVGGGDGPVCPSLGKWMKAFRVECDLNSGFWLLLHDGTIEDDGTLQGKVKATPVPRQLAFT